MASLDKKYISQLRRASLGYAEKRRAVIKASDDALHLAKRAIFAMHRDNLVEAKRKMLQAEGIFKSLGKKYKGDKQVRNEGSYRAAIEEYVEARLLYSFLTDKKLGEIKEVKVEPFQYIAGLCDVPGELYRYAIKAATEGDLKTVKKCAKVAQEISGVLIEFNLTSYLRTKFDQAKQSVNKLERIVYETTLNKS